MPLLCKASPRLARGTRVGADLPNAPAAIAAHRPDPLLGAVHTGTGEHVPWEVFATRGGRLGGHRVVSAESEDPLQPSP